jgi:hypothetical protein
MRLQLGEDMQRKPNVKQTRKFIAVRAPKDHYSWGWIVWTAICAIGFAVLEGNAIRRRRYDRTLSVHWRRAMGIHPRKSWHVIGRAVVLFGCFWIAQHIVFAPHEHSTRWRRYLNMIEEATDG